MLLYVSPVIMLTAEISGCSELDEHMTHAEDLHAHTSFNLIAPFYDSFNLVIKQYILLQHAHAVLIGAGEQFLPVCVGDV